MFRHPKTRLQAGFWDVIGPLGISFLLGNSWARGASQRNARPSIPNARHAGGVLRPSFHSGHWESNPDYPALEQSSVRGKQDLYPALIFSSRGGENRTPATRPPALCTAIILHPENLVPGPALRTAIILWPAFARRSGAHAGEAREDREGGLQIPFIQLMIDCASSCSFPMKLWPALLTMIPENDLLFAA